MLAVYEEQKTAYWLKQTEAYSRFLGYEEKAFVDTVLLCLRTVELGKVYGHANFVIF